MTEEPQESVNDYLWDRTGEPDPLVAALERRLAPLSRAANTPRISVARRRSVWRGVFLVAAIALLTTVPFFFLEGPASKLDTRGYELALRTGSARVRVQGSSETPLSLDTPGKFPVGSTLVCDAGAAVTLNVGQDPTGRDLGEVSIEGPSTLRLDESTEELKKLFLQRGTMRARISALAKERLFQVGTPVGNAVDLGCVYTMTVNDDHTTLLRVQLGRVAFEVGKQSVFVWAGARCTVDRDRGAGLPFDEGAEVAFVNAAERWSSALDEAARREAALAMRKAARVDDAATLWHVVARSPASERAFAVEQLESLTSVSSNCSLADLVKGEPAALESCRVGIMGW